MRPGSTDTFYISSGAQAYEVHLAGGTWTWTAVGSGLPGQPIVDLWIGDVGTAATPKVLLRAAVVTRGVWEADVTAGAGTPAPAARPYVRHHALDQGWLSPSIEGQVDPFNPGAGPSLYHWESPDIKVDAQRPGAGGDPAFFQTDPENPAPISHVAFDQLRDYSQTLPQSDQANVHVQVHNRSNTPVSGVNVWAVWCRPAGVVPSLAQSPTHGNMYDFWSQFHADGSIQPSLPSDSPWTPVGAPAPLDAIDAATPRVATFANWTVPTLLPGDPGHYCVVAFVHSQLQPINETNTSVDAIAVSNPQVAQKNLHVTTLLPIMLLHGTFGMRELIEFHAPGAQQGLVDLVFDLSTLPSAMHGVVMLTRLDTHRELSKSVSGAVVGEAGTGRSRPAAVEAATHFLNEWAVRFEEAAEREDRDRDRDDRLPRFTPSVFHIEPSARFELSGVRLHPGRPATSIFAITTTDRSLIESDHTFRVYQRAGKRILGGSTYVIRAAEPSRSDGEPLPRRSSSSHPSRCRTGGCRGGIRWLFASSSHRRTTRSPPRIPALPGASR